MYLHCWLPMSHGEIRRSSHTAPFLRYLTPGFGMSGGKVGAFTLRFVWWEVRASGPETLCRRTFAPSP